MTTKQQNYSDMAHTAGNTVKENQTLWSAIPRFVTLDENLNTALANLDSADKEAKIITTGTTKDKEKAKAQAIAAIIKIAGPACVYALDNNNNALHDHLNVTETTFKKVQDGNLPQLFNSIIEKVKPLAEPLVEFGVVAEDFTGAETKIQVYTDLVNDPRQLITERSTKIESVAFYIDELHQIFYRLDKMILLFVGTEFYSQYRNARKIVDRGIRKKQEKENKKSE
ncbi:MAG TPA: hypothetical protein DDW85_00170 [Porphyromonadaceae bacterium]|nr:hypothetical protein [Porphyromonadaceae bacterium]